jgi:peptidoglycan/xylan/chitin deacetylase (PgdA/CDA1 family)
MIRAAWGGAKLLAAEAACRLGLVPRLLHLQRHRPLILRYHRIYPDGVKPFYELGIPRSVFEAQLDFLKGSFQVLPLAEICAALKDPRRPFPARAVAITFDDGYRDNYTEALPALRERQLPATLFVSVNNVDRGEPFWWDRLARAIFGHPPGPLEVDLGHGRRRFELDGIHSRRSLLDHARESLKRMPASRARQTLDELEASAPPGPPHPSLEASLLTWEQVGEMQQGGFEVGAHTLDHPVLSQLPPGEAEWQIAESRRRLENRLGRPVRLFSYPNGKRADANPAIRQMVRAAGYEAAVSTIEGRVGPGSDPFWLERKGVPLGATADEKGCFSEPLFATELSGLYDVLFQRRRRDRALH